MGESEKRGPNQVGRESRIKMPCRWETCLMISTKKFFLAGPGLGTLEKPKYHYMVVGGLLVQELEPLKDLKAEKG